MWQARADFLAAQLAQAQERIRALEAPDAEVAGLMGRGLDAVAIARLCGWLERAELPAPPLDTLPGVQAFDVELMRRQVLHSVQVGDGDYPTALARLRYLAVRYGPPEIAALARPDELPHPPRRQQD